ANGFKPKTLKTRVGRVDLRIPQTRDYRDENGRPFYPRSLERGVRSERAMTLAVAEMYVQGVSTRKVTAIVEELCGLEITSTQVSRAALSPPWSSLTTSLTPRMPRSTRLWRKDRQCVSASESWTLQPRMLRLPSGPIPMAVSRAQGTIAPPWRTFS
ncbi:MAG: hypothetical protein EBU31_18095, partial [Proteobacteria bacterium]|nr:hypothetical protein [Pseudomonadota bacterium]